MLASCNQAERGPRYDPEKTMSASALNRPKSSAWTTSLQNRASACDDSRARVLDVSVFSEMNLRGMLTALPRPLHPL